MEKQKDYAYLYASCVAYFGGYWSDSANTGTFHLNVNNTTSNSNTNIAAHLKFSMLSLPLNFGSGGI